MANGHPEYDFVRHSVENWPRHYQFAVDGGRVDQPDLDNSIFQFFCHKRAITTAAAHGALEAVTELYSYCADAEGLGEIQRSAVDNAAAGGHATIVSSLLSQLPNGGEDRHSNDAPPPTTPSLTRVDVLPDTSTP
ncbi:hypothetical protein F5X98DRAFT_380821 [Xylaria grammica]|nr:hypothetical protein F5X98DRAFT_380821 [Xylaria grammica]